jgi:hypothetical protein
LRTHLDSRFANLKLKAALAVAAALLVVPATLAQAGDGGTGPSGSHARPGKARLVNGKAIAPSNAPRRVVRVIAAANRIRNKPYKWGGGHGRWNDRGYDCSGAVSYALHGGRLVKRPLDSSGFMRWGKRGRGRWITVFSNPGHAYLKVAGLRFDTSNVRGNGPGWSKRMPSSSGYHKRHRSRF